MGFHKQPLFFLVLGLGAGTLAPLWKVSAPLLIALALAGFLCLAAIARPAVVPLFALVVAAAAAGAAMGAITRAEYEQRAIPESLRHAAGPVLLEGIVRSDPRLVDDEIRFDLRATRVIVEGRPLDYEGRLRVFVRRSVAEAGASGRIEEGDSIRAWVELRSPEPPRTPGGFDQLEWSMREGLQGFASCKSERLITIVRRRPSPPSPLSRIRASLKESWRHVEDPLDRAVTASMVLGDEGALDQRTREEFRSAGLLHILVVSGSQVAALIIGLRRVMGARLRIAWSGCLLECAVLTLYCLVAGAEDSIVRATVMAIAFSVAVRVDLQRGGANFVAASALALLTLRPLDLLDPGAQMSFIATLALVTFAGASTRRLAGLGLPGVLAEAVAATLVATLAVSPLTLSHFHRLSLIAIPANLLAAPLAMILLYGSLATAALDAGFGPAAALLGSWCGLAAHGLRSVAHHAASLDPDWRGPGLSAAAWLGLMGLVGGEGWRRRALPVAALLATLTMSGLPRADGRSHFWFLDVGQGDALLIETPGGRVGLVDAGPAFDTFDAGERVVAEALWALGHRRIDFMAITHRHADHAGGAPFLARHFQPARIYVNEPSEALREFAPSVVRRGASWTLDGVSFRVLGPAEGWPLPRGDENARSLLIDVRYGAASVLLLADASMLAERLMEIGETRYDAVKVAHHGAATSSSKNLVEGTRPRIAVISVGERNRFSHPAREVTERWRRAGSYVWRTDTAHTLHLTSDGVGIVW